LKVLARQQSDAPHTRKVLFESLGISVVDFRCQAHVAAEGGEEPNPTHSIVLVRRGVFRRTHRREIVLADPNHVLLFNGTEPYRYAHPLPGGDACTILTVETDRALELVGRYAPADAEHPERPFRRGHGLSSPRAVWLHWEFLNLVARQASRLALEDALAELANEAVACAYRAPVPSRRASPPARRRRRDLVEAVKLMISERLDGPPSLTELADVLGCSPYHLSHTFHGRPQSPGLRQAAEGTGRRRAPSRRCEPPDGVGPGSRLRGSQPLHELVQARVGRVTLDIPVEVGCPP